MGDKDKRNTHMDAHSMKDAAVFRKLADNDVKKVLDSLNNKKELQMLLADAYTPYDEVDPVFYSALLRDDLPTFLDRFNVTEEEFLSDYRQVRHLTTSTQELRASFQQKYAIFENCEKKKGRKRLRGHLIKLFLFSFLEELLKDKQTHLPVLRVCLLRRLLLHLQERYLLLLDVLHLDVLLFREHTRLLPVGEVLVVVVGVERLVVRLRLRLQVRLELLLRLEHTQLHEHRGVPVVRAEGPLRLALFRWHLDAVAPRYPTN